MSVAGLLLGDSRFPAGGHAHSGGVEPAVTAGTVSDLRTLEVFLRGRLRTVGLIAAAIAAAACAHARPTAQIMKYPEFRGAGFAPEIPDGADGADTAGRVDDTSRLDRAGDAERGADPLSTVSAGVDRIDPAEGVSEAGGLRQMDGAGANAGSALTGAPGNRVPAESAANPVFSTLPAPPSRSGGGEKREFVLRNHGFWSELDAEADARTPSPAQREASRRQGRALLRAARVAWPDASWLAELAASARTGAARGTGRSAATGTAAAGGGGGQVSVTYAVSGPGTASAADPDGGAGPGGAARREYRGGPHHAVVLGAAAAAAGCDPQEAARIAAYQAVAGPVSAAVRLLALDPMRATGVLSRLSGDIELIASQGAAYADGPASDLPCPSAPALDLLAETHIRAEVRLFES
jgi:urease accessory protein